MGNQADQALGWFSAFAVVVQAKDGSSCSMSRNVVDRVVYFGTLNARNAIFIRCLPYFCRCKIL